MKKYFGTIGCVVAMLCAYIIVDSNSIYETIDSQSVYGGTCYQIADIKQCQGGTATCGTTVCTNLNCPVASQPMKVKKTDYWYPSAKPAETGRTSNSP